MLIEDCVLVTGFERIVRFFKPFTERGGELRTTPVNRGTDLGPFAAELSCVLSRDTSGTCGRESGGVRCGVGLCGRAGPARRTGRPTGDLARRACRLAWGQGQRE